MGTSGTFKIVRTPASYIISRSRHRKWEKTGSFRISANYSNAKFLRGIQGMPLESWRPGLSENVPELWLVKVNRDWNFSNVSKNKKPYKKKTQLQFCVLGSAIESASKHTYWANADSIWKLETHNCSRVIFLYAFTRQLFFFGIWPNFDQP